MTVSTSRPQLIQYQIVVGALALGLLSFAVVAYLLGSGEEGDKGPVANILIGVAAALLVGGFIAGLIVRRLALGRLRTRWAGEKLEDTDELLPPFGTVAIVRGALAEGPGFLFLITYMLYGKPVALAGAALAAVALLGVFPSRNAFEAFVSRVLDRRDFVPR